MRRVLICLGLTMSLVGLSACGGGGDGSSASSGGGGSGSPVTSSSISLPSSVQIVTSN